MVIQKSKKTGLWLKGLPKFYLYTYIGTPEKGYWENQTPSGQNKGEGELSPRGQDRVLAFVEEMMGYQVGSV